MSGTFINEDIEAAVSRAMLAAGGKNVGILGASLAKQCLECRLLDEIVIHLAPCCSAMACRCSRLPAVSAFGSSQPR
jgi:dihydrofolate reductase